MIVTQLKKALRGRSLLLLVMSSALIFVSSPLTLHAQSNEKCFTETGQCMGGRILEFWQQNGGLSVFGYPIGAQHSEVIEGQEVQAQRFERNRLELHPEKARPYDVLLGRLGLDRLVAQGRDWNSFPKGQRKKGCLFFEETGHSLCSPFLSMWQAKGLEFDGRRGKSYLENLALFGLPLSEPQTETMAGQQYTVQWFERARFEYHPENQQAYKVLLGLLGNELYPHEAPVFSQAIIRMTNDTSGTITATLNGRTDITKSIAAGQTVDLPVAPGTYTLTVVSAACQGSKSESLTLGPGDVETLRYYCKVVVIP